MIELFQTLFVHPLLNLLVAMYQLFSFLHIPSALGFSIVGLTVLIRLLLSPLTATQLKASKKMQDISPHISRIRDQHKNDAKRIQEETMRLYKEHGVNPAAGCLPVLLQLPLIWALYSVLQEAVRENANVVAEVNKVVYVDALKLQSPWNTHFFGIPLGQTPSHLVSVLPLIVLIPLITAILQFIQSKMMVAAKPTASIKQVKKKGEEKKQQDDFAQAFQTQSLYIFPIMIGWFSYTLPAGLSLYWNTFTLFGILQQYQVHGLGGLSDLPFLKERKNK
ncbi:MAG: YidC/Oxa1 family membrane protein insertase [Candidatus Levybacteria bacterium]|nr:YidC/Oxa1 family membrane protein insertase [Candidatus Levybacteria bacterium]